MGNCNSNSQRRNQYASSGDGDSGGGGDDGSKGKEQSEQFRTLTSPHEEGEIVHRIASCGKGLLLSAGEDKRIVLTKWDAAGKSSATASSSIAAVGAGHTRGVNDVAVAISSRMVYSVSRDLSVRQWKLPTEAELRCVSINRFLAPSHRNTIYPTDVLLTKPRCLISDFVSAEPLAIKEMAKWDGHDLTVSAVSVNADESKVASGARDTSVRVWDAATGKQISIRKISRNLVTCLQWLPGSTSEFVQGSEDLRLRMWDARNGIVRASLTFSGYTYFPLDVDCRCAPLF